jgi:hypothetical protein
MKRISLNLKVTGLNLATRLGSDCVSGLLGLDAQWHSDWHCAAPDRRASPRRARGRHSTRARVGAASVLGVRAWHLELLLFRFENLILKVLIELVLLIACMRSGHTYDKRRMISTMHTTRKIVY